MNGEEDRNENIPLENTDIRVVGFHKDKTVLYETQRNICHAH